MTRLPWRALAMSGLLIISLSGCFARRAARPPVPRSTSNTPSVPASATGGAGAPASPARPAPVAPAPAAPVVRDPAAPVPAADYTTTLETRRQSLIERGLRLGAEDVGYYMDVQEARLRQAGGTALRLTRRGPSVILELPGQLNFEVGSASLSPAAITALTAVARILVDYRMSIISVEGHTDDSGDAAGNRTLSEQRAAAVAKLLVSNGVEPERLVVTGRGSDRPVADNTTEVGREANRRVVLRVDPLRR